MDLEFTGHGDLAAAFVDAYVEASGDGELRELLAFYKAYRAYVRAKVSSFQSDDAMVSAADKARLRDTPPGTTSWRSGMRGSSTRSFW